MSEQVDTFLAITGSSDGKVAEHFIDMAGGDIETAISLFFEHGPSITTQTTGSGAGASASPQPQSNVDDDAALAERLQNEAYQSQQAEPRAPDQAVHETLVGGDSSYGVFPGTFGGVGGSFGSLLNNRATGAHDIFGNARPGIFNQRDEEFGHDDDSDDEDRVVEIDSEGEIIESRRDDGLSATQRRLARIFRPPFDLIQKLDLTSGKQKARTEKKWLLVNIQDNAEFQCQVLNRDFWSNKNVKDLVKENFIFLQYQKDSRSGEEYSQFYQFTEYPHISILDPITGERLKMWSGVPAVNSWIQEVFDFLGQFSLELGHINPIVSHKKKIDPSSLTEEQQLEFAISQSLGNNHEDKDDVEILHGGDKTDPIQIDDPEEEAAPKELTETELFERIKPVEHPEPEANTATTTRVQIRLGDGSRQVRRFNIDDKVVVIYEVLKATVDQVKKGEGFTLTSQRENLIGKLDESISEAGLKNASILLELVDKDE